MKKIILVCTLIFFLVPFTPCLAYNLTDYQYEETRELIRFVAEAVEEIERATAPSGKDYLVGSGNYEMKCEKVFLIDLVNKAVSLLGEKGLDALEEMRLQSSEFILMDSYIFIKDDEGNELLNIAFPELEGTNVANKQDSNGKYFVREVLTTLRTEDDCWIEYMWPKPGQTESSRKLAYEKKVLLADITLIVGAGYYLD